MKIFAYIVLISFAIIASTISCWAGTATLSWEPNPETDMAGYKVYYGTAPATYIVVEDVGSTSTPNAPQHTVNDLVEGETYYFAVSAYDTSGNQSSFSDEVSKFIAVTAGGGSGSGGSGGGSSAFSSGGGGAGCGRIKVSDRQGSSPGQVALNFALLALPFILVKIRKLLKMISREVQIVSRKAFTEMILKPIMISTFLILLLPFAAFAAPVIFYTDIVSGPNTGGENNNGTYLSIFGKGFGTAKGTNDKVTINGVEVAAYKQWGSPSKVFDSHGIQVITVQPGSKVSSGPIVVTVNGVTSNSNHSFTIVPGNIYFVDGINGNDSTGTVNDITKPYKSAQNRWNALSPGDHIILRGGDWVQKGDGSNFLKTNSNKGTVAAPVAMIGYPGEDIHLQRVGDIGYAQIQFNAGTGSYTTISNIHTDGDNAFPSTAQSGPVYPSNVRLVNNEIENFHATGGGSALITGPWINTKMLGMSVHDVGDDKLFHGIYIGTRDGGDAHDIEIAWNQIYDINGNNDAGRAIQCFSQGVTTGTVHDVLIHDNVIHDVSRHAISMGEDCTTGFEVYNNVIYRTGLNEQGGIRANSDQLVAGIYNNTVYDNRYGIYLEYAITLTIKNNAIQSLSGQSYSYDDPGFTGTIIDSHNLFFGVGSPPSWADGEGTLNTDPKLVDPTSPARNFHLLSASPAIDAGVNTGVGRDLDGTLRPQGTAFDVGAYEYCTSNCPIVDPIPPTKPTGLTVK